MTLLKGRTFIVLVLLVIFFTIVKGTTFLSASTLTMVAKHVALYGILALGMTFVIITGGIDLSVGSVVGLVGMLAGGMIQEGITLKFAGVTLYFSVPVIIITMLVVGCIIGAVNGLIVDQKCCHNKKYNGKNISHQSHYSHEYLADASSDISTKSDTTYHKNDRCRHQHQKYDFRLKAAGY